MVMVDLGRVQPTLQWSLRTATSKLIVSSTDGLMVLSLIDAINGIAGRAFNNLASHDQEHSLRPASH